ncbi:MAG TPA: helix-turn-helix transcriptional regulator [Bacillaceae bacterium]
MDNTNIQRKIIRRFFETRVKNKQNFFAHPSFAVEQRLLSALTRGEMEDAKLALDAINSQERATLAQDSVRSLKNSLICSCTLFTRAVIRGGVHPESAFSLSDVYILQIEETNDLDSLRQLEYEMLYSFHKSLQDEKQPSYNLIVNKTIAFIHDEILNDLSLDRIADHVSVHPNYLSRTFRDEVGMSITEYINRKRIEDSKYFLLHSDSPILDIAVLLGFCNQSYYTRLFKKYTMMTPLQYRNMNAQNPNSDH